MRHRCIPVQMARTGDWIHKPPVPAPSLGSPMPTLSRPINLLPPALVQCLASIEPGVRGTPCSIVLNNGSTHPLALAWENPRYGDAGDWINPERVAYLTECPGRMPARLARIIHDAGESGMGYHIYVVRLSDGSSFVHTAGNLGIDLLNLPVGYTSRDVVAVEPHVGRQRIECGGYRFVSDWASLEYAIAGENGTRLRKC